MSGRGVRAGTDGRTWVQGLGLLVLAASVVWWALRSGLDFKVYWYAARTVVDDASHLYDPMLGPIYNPGLPFTYPPFAAIAFTPLALVSQRAGIVVFALLSFAAVWMVTRTIIRFVSESSHRHPSAAVTAGLLVVITWSGPFRDSIIFGQINIFLLVVIVSAVRRFGWSFWSGFVIGVCGGIKLTPLALVLAPLARRDVAACAGVVCGFGTTVGIGFALLPTQSVQFWFHVLRDPSRVGGLGYVDNVSLRGLLVRFGLDGTVEWAVLSGIVILLIGVLIASRSTLTDLQGLAFAALAMLIVSPVTWSHHWVWVVVVAAVWIQMRREYGRSLRSVIDVAVALLTVYLFVSPKLLVFLLGYDVDRYVPAWLTHLSDIPVLASVVVVVAMIIGDRRSRQRPPILATLGE